MKFVVNFNSQRIAKRLFITYLSFNYSLLLGLRFLLERERRLCDICLRDFVVISDLFFSLILLTLVSARNITTSQGAGSLANFPNFVFSSFSSRTLSRYLF